MRGAGLLGLVRVVETGIIPARAGSSSRSRPRGTGSWDHPRACGEQALRFFTTLISSGSSPRVRGAALDGEGLAPRLGIIPAYAGSSAGLGSSCPARWDHPHVCGEQLIVGKASSCQKGSSPRMRGAETVIKRLAVTAGIIPAHAGSRETFMVQFVSGEGSSPRMRGAGLWCLPHHLPAGIIPAHAGSSSESTAQRRATRDHPRACGEQRVIFTSTTGEQGSSPRMRGAAKEGRLQDLPGGIIPAHAGSSATRSATSSRAWDHPRACGEQLIS